jgi:hypothetical protein
MSASEKTGNHAHDHRPLGGYAALTSVFGTAVTGSLIAAHRSGRPLPDAVRPWDVVTMGVATHKITRLIAKDRVTSWVRAPFVRYEEPAGHGEVTEQPRGSGLRLALGELLVCPYCLGQWVAAGLGVGFVASPRLTRLIAAIYTAETISDFLQLGYLAAEERASP